MVTKQWFMKLFVALGLCGPMLLFVEPAPAVIHVRDVSWNGPGPVHSYPQWSDVTVSFRADFTQHDRDRGVEFSIDILGIEADHPRLVYYYGVVSDVPADVPTATFEVRFPLFCSEERRRINPWTASCRMSYVVPGRGNTTRVVPDGITTSYDIRGTFGLAVAGEDRVLGPNELPANSLACSGKSIGIYFDAEGTICHGTIHPGTPGTLYVLAKVGGDPSGIAGAEFRLAGVPSSWQTFAVPNPIMLAIGDPFGDGVTAGFPCQQSAEIVPLYTVLVLASEEVPEVQFTIERRLPTSPIPILRCPLVVLCDAPQYTEFCVEGGQCMVNASRPHDCSGRITGIATLSWSAVKSLYRN